MTAPAIMRGFLLVCEIIRDNCSAAQQKAIFLHFLKGDSYSIIGEKMDCSGKIAQARVRWGLSYIYHDMPEEFKDPRIEIEMKRVNRYAH